MKCRRLYLLIVVLALVFVMSKAEVQIEEGKGLWAKDGDSFKVEFVGNGRATIRYASINAPGEDQCFGPEAREYNHQLVKDKNLWLEMNPVNGGYEMARGRILAHVFTDSDFAKGNNIETTLVSNGFAQLNVINPVDREIDKGENFDVRYGGWLIDAQVKAAINRQGWWGECDDYSHAKLVIAVIKFWSDSETVYIINRGQKDINLSQGWKLQDPKHELIFGKYLPMECILPSQGLLKVYSGPIASERKGKHTACGQSEIKFYWTGRKVWNNTGDEAWLYDPKGDLVYYYKYPLPWD